jgi:catechol 2,3-dioxygenase-like lactoylglutathione lyase family enzyme
MDQAIDFYSQVLSFRKISDGDLLALKLAGESENYGTEQEDLNNVSGARLHISDLRALDGPSIEFLEYLNPRDGRDFPMNTRSDDLFHWQTTLIVDDAETVAQRLRANGYIFVSSGVIEIPQQTLGFKKGFLVKDPDGHVVRIVEK